MTMLEKACRAACVADGVDPDAWRAREKFVRAILSAIRTPNDAMDHAADDKIGHGAHEDWGGAYTAMIDAILAEEPKA